MSTQKKKMSKTAKKKQLERRQINNRRGILLIALLAVSILVVNVIAYSYSWFTPISATGVGLALDTSATIRSEKCIFETYLGTLVTDSNWESSVTINGVSTTYKDAGYYIDQVAYSETPIRENDYVTIPAATTTTENGKTVTVPGRVYFRTNVQNTDTVHPSVISLYHHQFPNTLGLGVTFPSNTYFINDFGDYDDCFILRNAYVKRKDEADVDGPGLLQVEWFVENFSTSQTINIWVTRQTKDGGTFSNDTTNSALKRYSSGGTDKATPIEWMYLMYN